MRENRTERKHPLDSHEFQDFLADQGALIRGRLDPDRWILKAFHRDREHLETLLHLVSKTPGYIVPSTALAKEVYGFADRDELRALPHRGYDLRKHIEDPNALFVAQIGQGVGVDSLELSTVDTLDPVYALWQDLGKFVHPDVLFNRLYSHHKDEASIGVLNYRFSRLKQRVKFRNAVIEGADFNNERHFRLRVLEDQEVTSGQSEGIYQKEFQQWLGKVGVFTFSKASKIELKKRSRGTLTHDKLMTLLMNNAHLIVPLEKIRGIYFRQEVPEDWQRRLTKNLYVFRQRCVDGDVIFSGKDLGWAFGIESLNLSKSELVILNCLWKNSNNFIDSESITKRSRIGNIFAAISEVRRALLTSRYLIGSNETDSGLDYILAHEDDFVRPEAHESN